MQEIVILYVPCKNTEEAQSLSTKLVQEKLVACTNTFPITSCFYWGKVQNEQEIVLLAKTIKEHESSVRAVIEQQHTYDTPCIVSWKVEVNDAYAEWVKKTTNNL